MLSNGHHIYQYCPHVCTCPQDVMKQVYNVYFDQDFKSKIIRQILKVDSSCTIPFQIGYLSEIVPTDKIVDGQFEELAYPAFNHAGLLKQTITVGYNGHYYLEVRPKFYLSDIVVEPKDVELNLLVNKTSFIYQLINFSDTRISISLTGELKRDTEDIYSKVCNNLKDIGWRIYSLNKMLVKNRTLDEYNQYPDYLTAQEVAWLLRKSSKTIRNWTSAGHIPHKKINGSILYLKTDIKNWVEKK